MGRSGNRGYGKAVADAVLTAGVGDRLEGQIPGSRSWLSTWVEPGPARDRFRKWLSMWLKGATEDIPPDLVGRYLREMTDDVMQLGTDRAIDRFVDKILPKILSNEAATSDLDDRDRPRGT